MSQFDFETRIIEYHFFSTYTTDELYKNVYTVLERNQIHSSDAGILGSKVEILRDLDFAIRTKRHENTSVTFESEEEYQKFKNNKNKIEELRRFKKNHFYMKTGTVKLSTIHSFKGWEIDTLFLFIEKEDDNTDENPEDFTTAELIYTGLTRARKNLIVFNLGNQKYNEFFKSEIQTQFYHNHKKLYNLNDFKHLDDDISSLIG